MMDPFTTGRKLAADIRSGKISSVQATEFYINRIETLDKETNLVVVKMVASIVAKPCGLSLQRSASTTAPGCRDSLAGCRQAAVGMFQAVAEMLPTAFQLLKCAQPVSYKECVAAQELKRCQQHFNGSFKHLNGSLPDICGSLPGISG